ncbi:MAG: hypothetical protein IKU46_02650 [Peptococcaceae bacterium]|nr:hypothetical protein [Peptococcaceae bacterium]
MKKNVAIAVLTVAVMLFGAGCGGDNAALDSVQVDMYQETHTVGDVTVEVTYPVVSAEEEADKLIETLNRQFQSDAEAFVDMVAADYAETAQPDDMFAYQADVLFNENGMLSIVEGQCCGQDYFQYAATYSLTDGEKMTLGELMDMKEDKAEETIIKQFGGVIQSYPDAFNDDAADYVASHIDEVQYYRYSEGLGVFFPVGTIAPEEMGVQEMVMQ